MSLQENNTVTLPSVPANLLIAGPSTEDAQADASRFLVDNSSLLAQTSVDHATTRFQTLMAMYRAIPSWLMMPLFVICLVFFVVIGLPLFIVFTRLVKEPKTLMRISSLISLGWIVAIISIFI